MSALGSSGPRLVAAGYTTLDTVSYGRHLTHRAGGTAANVAAILAWLGWESHLAALIGNDAAGRRLNKDLKQLGVRLDFLARETRVRTPQVIHEIADGSHRFLFRCPECGQRFPRSRPLSTVQAEAVLDRVDTADVFFFDRANPGTLALAEEFRRRDALVVFEPSVAGPAATMERATQLAHIAKFSDDRLSVLWSALPGPAPDQVQVVTRGAHGAVARRGKRKWAESTSFEAHVIDSGGAGDWTTAGLLYQLGGATHFDQDQLLEALRFGQALAALNCEWPGARGLLDHRSVEQALRDTQRLLRAAPRRDDRSATRRTSATRRRASGCPACLAPADAAIESSGRLRTSSIP